MKSTMQPPAMVQCNTPYTDCKNKESDDAKCIGHSEQTDFTDYCQKAYEKTREKLIAADCRAAARRLKQYMVQFNTGPASMREMRVDWTGVLESLLELYCRDAILNQIKNTPKDARGKWTKALLDKKIQACELDITAQNVIYEMAGLEQADCTSKIAKFPLQESGVESDTIFVGKTAVSG